MTSPVPSRRRVALAPHIDAGRSVPSRPRPATLASLLAGAMLAACGGGTEAPSAAIQGDAGAVASSSPPPTPATQPPDPSPGGLVALASCGLPAFAEDALRRINALRATGASCGARGAFAPAPPLAWNVRLDAAAAGHSQDMATRDYVAHVSPDGLGPGERIAAQDYDARAWAENIAAGHRDTPVVLAAWMDSDGHCANLMHPGVREFALACVRGPGTRYATYWTLKLAAAR